MPGHNYISDGIPFINLVSSICFNARLKAAIEPELTSSCGREIYWLTDDDDDYDDDNNNDDDDDEWWLSEHFSSIVCEFDGPWLNHSDRF